MTSNEIADMRAWVAETARRLSTLGPMPGQAAIDALPDERIVELVEQHYVGGARLFRYCIKNGLEP